MAEEKTQQTKKFYHCTTVSGIKELSPRVSTHGKKYVYATDNFALSLFFGSDKSFGDFDGMYGINRQGKPYFYEAYSGALKRRFENVEAYIYEVDPKDFKEGQTSFSAEVVSDRPVTVLNCAKVDDVYNLLMSLIQDGEIDYKEYDKDFPEYVEMIDRHIEDRVQRFGILDNKQSNVYKFCKEKFSDILKKVESEI